MVIDRFEIFTISKKYLNSLSAAILSFVSANYVDLKRNFFRIRLFFYSLSTPSEQLSNVCASTATEKKQID